MSFNLSVFFVFYVQHHQFVFCWFLLIHLLNPLYFCAARFTLPLPIYPYQFYLLIFLKLWFAKNKTFLKSTHHQTSTINQDLFFQTFPLPYPISLPIASSIPINTVSSSSCTTPFTKFLALILLHWGLCVLSPPSLFPPFYSAYSSDSFAQVLFKEYP